jgi:hypothetical protein
MVSTCARCAADTARFTEKTIKTHGSSQRLLGPSALPVLGAFVSTWGRDAPHLRRDAPQMQRDSLKRQ